jgi:nicotinate-nucleotide adenylyltransferase
MAGLNPGGRSPEASNLQRLGVFGGTFDPPHLGHFILAAEAIQQLALTRLLWVLTADPPHKQGRAVTPASERLAMLQAALASAEQAGETGFELSLIDIDRPPPHYAIDTLALLRQQHPGAALVYLMGADSLADLPTWHRPQEFIARCDEIGVMRRPGQAVDLAALESQLPGLSVKVRFFAAPLVQISSTELRKWLASGRNCHYYLPPGVLAVIETRRIYR